jgi:hypothetical protein
LAASDVVATRPAICLNELATSPNWRVPRSTAFDPPSVAMTVVLTAARISSTRARISFVDPPTRSASLRISSATTLKRLPISPAPADSMVALIARMFVCSASSLMISRIPPICCDFFPRSSMWVTIASTCRRIVPTASLVLITDSSPLRAAEPASLAIWATRRALSAI